MGFNLSSETEVMESIHEEAKKTRISKTKYINNILIQVFEVPKALTSGTCLDELQAYSRLFSDDLMEKIPALADKERRSPDQMLLYLVELGIETIENRAVKKKS